MGGIPTVELRVLGAFELVVGGQRVAVGSEKQRLLLAALAVNAGRVVSEDRLIEALWDERPPVTAHATLQKYVYRLRGILERSRSNEATLRVETQSNGYSLIFSGAELDADQFVGSIAEARRVTGGDAFAALRLYDDALSLWRGPPWEEFADRDPFRTDATRLEALRIAAIEERVDIALACGRHRELIVELEATVAAFPLHERSRGQLMLALYRSGRQVDALRAFREFRSYLVAETGLEPSRELQELEDDIIQQKRHLDLPGVDVPDGRLNASSSAPVASSFPAQLLGTRAATRGRSADLDWLEELWSRALSDGPHAAVLSGPAGIGKTHLIVEFARRAHARGAHVVYRTGGAGDLRGSSMPSHSAGGVLVVIDDLDAANVGDSAGALSAMVCDLRDSTTLVVAALRNAPTAAQLGLVLSRELTPFDTDDVALVLADVAGLVEPGLADAVFEETAGVPALVVAVGEKLRERDLAARLDRALDRAERAGTDLRAAQDEIGATALDRVQRKRHTSAPPAGACPYKGLAPFEASDAAVFCGRDRLVAAVVARLAVSRFVGIVGASGSGKSSLVRAGMVPALAGAALPQSERWATTVLTPGANPVDSLEQSLATCSGDAPRQVVVVDQFEEVFTTCRDARVRDLFMDKLVATATSTLTNTAIVVVLRADYYGMCGAHPGFARLLERSQVLVGAMSASELRDAIIEPAAHVGLRVDDALVEVVCRDAGSEPGALPLVSTALAETWVHREDHTLTVAAYENAGGVQGALARLADRAYERLDASQRVVARRIFSRLAEVGEGNDDVRRRAARGEIDAIEGASEVLSVLTAHRLVTADRDRVEVAHEALLREWPRLRGWLEDDRDGRRLHQRLAETAAEWERDARDPAVLYRGTKLDAAAEWSGNHPDELTSTEASFVAASAAAQADDLQVARRSARRSHLMVTGLTVLLVVALVSAAVTVRQWRRATNASSRAGTAARNAELGRLDALARSLPTDSGDLALLLGVEAHRMAPSVETEGALESALLHSPPGLERIIRFDSPTFYPTPSPDGRLLAFAGDGDVRLLDLQSGRVVRTLHSDHPLTGAFFNADGTELASRSSDGTAIVWDAATGRPVGASIRSPGSLVYPEFDPADPSDLYTVSDLGEVVRWDRHDPAHPRRIGEPFRFPLQTIKGSPPVIAFAPDGGLLAVAPTNGDASTTAVWDVRRHALLQTFSGTPYGFAPDGATLVLSNGRDLEFRDARSGALRGKPQHGSGDAQPGGLLSADRRLVAVRNGNDTIDVYDLASRKRIGKPLGVPASSVPTSFLPDGRLIVSTPTQASIWRVDTRVGALGVGLNDHGHQVIAWFVHDGQRVVTQSWDDGVTTSWDAGTGRRVGVLAHGRPVQDVSRDGRFASVGLSGGDVGVWDLASDRQVAMIDPHLGSQDASAFAPNGSLLAIAATHGHDPTVELWNVTDPGSPKIYKRLTVSSADGLVTGFSDDNRSLLVIDYPSSWITLFDVASGQRRWTHQFDAGMWQVTTSPDSRTVAIALNGLTDSGVRFLDARTGKEEGLLPSPEAIGVAYARGGRVIAVSGGINPSGTQLFDAATFARIGEPLPTPGATPFLVGSSPDGNRLAAGTGNGFAVLWDVDVEHWEQRACQIAGRNLSRDEWHQYVPDQSYRRTCPQWPAGQ